MNSDFLNQQILNYLKSNSLKEINLKAVLFDMDGVLFDSMKYHAKAWSETLTELGVYFEETEAYLHEGRTGEDTINIAFQRSFGRKVTKEEAKEIYQIKSKKFNDQPEAGEVPNIGDLLQKIKLMGLQRMIVTGSGQKSLIDRLNTHFPEIFKRDLMITADDVELGKPNPEPYLKALKKGGLQPHEAIVVENAPLGVEAAHKAKIFTIAVNTGPLPDQVLIDAGADLLFPDMLTLTGMWDNIVSACKEIKNI